MVVKMGSCVGGRSICEYYGDLTLCLAEVLEPVDQIEDPFPSLARLQVNIWKNLLAGGIGPELGVDAPLAKLTLGAVGDPDAVLPLISERHDKGLGNPHLRRRRVSQGHC